jgi:phage-related protein
LRNHKKVIFFPSPTLWSFFDYVSDGRNLIEEWYQKELSEEAQITFDTLLKNQQKIESVLNWTGFKYLKGKPKEERIWQLDFIADKRQYRLLGVFGMERKSAVLILGCYHKGDNYTPRDALEMARKRAKTLREGKAGTNERKIKSDS